MQVVGGAGVLSRGESLVGDTWPGSLVQQFVPHYKEYTLAHKANLQLLQASSLKWSAKPGVTIQLVVAADAQDNVYSRLHVPSRSSLKFSQNMCE